MALSRALPLLLGLASLVLVTPSALAASGPPPPPPPPVCGPCSGPPPPPTPVPYAPANVIPQTTVEHKVTLREQKVRRGQPLHVLVVAQRGETITFALAYWHQKPTYVKGKLYHDPPYVKTFSVPKNAPLGRASLKVTFVGAAGSSPVDPISVQFAVTH